MVSPSLARRLSRRRRSSTLVTSHGRSQSQSDSRVTVPVLRPESRQCPGPCVAFTATVNGHLPATSESGPPESPAPEPESSSPGLASNVRARAPCALYQAPLPRLWPLAEGGYAITCRPTTAATAPTPLRAAGALCAAGRPGLAAGRGEAGDAGDGPGRVSDTQARQPAPVSSLCLPRPS